jgi:hypothetical protein
MFWFMNHLIRSVSDVEALKERDIKDVKLKNTSHATMCSSHYLLMMMA